MGSHLFSLVEETMPLPVENATCANNRRVAPPADQGDFAALMEDYARCLLGQLPCMRMTDNTARRALYNTPRPGGGGLPHPAILRLLRF